MEKTALKYLISSEWWKIIKGNINEKINEIEKEILEDVSPDNNTLLYTKHDILRKERKALLEVMDFPEEQMAEAEEYEAL